MSIHQFLIVLYQRSTNAQGFHNRTELKTGLPFKRDATSRDGHLNLTEFTSRQQTHFDTVTRCIHYVARLEKYILDHVKDIQWPAYFAHIISVSIYNIMRSMQFEE